MSHFNKERFLTELKYFIGSEYFYKAPMFKGTACSYTEGVKYLAQEAKCYWLLDFIFARQISEELRCINFQTWTIKCKDYRATIKVTDGDDKHICDYMLPYSDFPLDEMTLWLIDQTLLLPTEY